MARSFEVSFQPAVGASYCSDWEAIQAHTSVAYILSPPLNQRTSQSMTGSALLLVKDLFDVGAVAVKSESGGVTHGRETWLKLVDDYSDAMVKDDDANASAALYYAWVRRGLLWQQEDVFYTVGMHLLGHRECEFQPAIDQSDAMGWIDLLALYLLYDKPDRAVLNGEGFRQNADGPRKIIRQYPCIRYEQDDFRHNPYGANRLTSAE